MTGSAQKGKPKNYPLSSRAKRAIGLVLSGEAKSLKGAAEKAGYAPSTAYNATNKVFRNKTVIQYLKKLDLKSRQKFGLSIQDNVMQTYFRGLKASKRYGKDAIKAPDYATRLQYADRFSKFFGWINEGLDNPQGKFNQFNFFNVDPVKQKIFHENLKNMVKKTYPSSSG